MFWFFNTTENWEPGVGSGSGTIPTPGKPPATPMNPGIHRNSRIPGGGPRARKRPIVQGGGRPGGPDGRLSGHRNYKRVVELVMRYF